jgi:hypothetical protein
MFSLSRFGPIRGLVFRHSVFRCSVPFDVQSFDVRSHSMFGLSMLSPFRCSVFRGLVFRRSVFRGSVFRGSVIRGSVTVSFSWLINCFVSATLSTTKHRYQVSRFWDLILQPLPPHTPVQQPIIISILKRNYSQWESLCINTGLVQNCFCKDQNVSLLWCISFYFKALVCELSLYFDGPGPTRQNTADERELQEKGSSLL